MATRKTKKEPLTELEIEERLVAWLRARIPGWEDATLESYRKHREEVAAGLHGENAKIFWDSFDDA